MTNRIFMQGNPPKIVVSKAGFNAASPTLANSDKVFDSTWAFGGGIIQAGLYDLPFRSTPGYYEITFPEQPDPPAVYVAQGLPKGWRTTYGNANPGTIIGLDCNVETFVENDRVKITHAGAGIGLNRQHADPFSTDAGNRVCFFVIVFAVW